MDGLTYGLTLLSADVSLIFYMLLFFLLWSLRIFDDLILLPSTLKLSAPFYEEAAVALFKDVAPTVTELKPVEDGCFWNFFIVIGIEVKTVALAGVRI